MKYLFTDFEDFAKTLGISKKHPSWKAFEATWQAARTLDPTDRKTQVIPEAEKDDEDWEHG